MTAVSILPKSQRLPGSFGGYAWYVVGVLMLVNALSYLDRQVMSILVIPITADLGFTDTQMGLILGPAFMMLFVLAGMPMGWLADKHNRALLLAFGILTWSLGTLATGLADTYAGMLGARYPYVEDRRLYAASSASAVWTVFCQFQGSNSWRRDWGMSLIRARVSASQACGSMSHSFAVPMRVYMKAARWPP